MTTAGAGAVERRRPLIVEVKPNSLEDGPGIRTTIFFKGCPLSCVWCQNPETVRPGPEVMRTEAECIRCGACVQACPGGAMRWAEARSAPEDRVPVRVRALCRACGRCARACPGRGVRLVGAYHEPEDLADRVALDLPFFRNSGGGATLSGGEATLYPRYLERLLEALSARGVGTILETCGYWRWEVFERRVLPYLDAVYFDLKLVDPVLHQRYTGRSNALILDNLERLARRRRAGGPAKPRWELLVRIPLVPGLTDTPANLEAAGRLLRRLGLGQVVLLPYNPLWTAKAAGLGQEPGYRREGWMSEAERRRCAETVRSFGIEVAV